MNGDGVFESSVNLYFNDDKLKFDNRYLDNQNHNFGSASGFVLFATVLPTLSLL